MWGQRPFPPPGYRGPAPVSGALAALLHVFQSRDNRSGDAAVNSRHVAKT
jgi:hypothetical protein